GDVAVDDVSDEDLDTAWAASALGCVGSLPLGTENRFFGFPLLSISILLEIFARVSRGGGFPIILVQGWERKSGGM
ncbi:hypothetical protein COCMIDRAFT_91158, partial [Bipolaris oryzae ATCC 44560]